MKAAIGSLTLAPALIVTPAATQSTSAAAEGPRVVPPKEFDHPFPAPGKVIVVPARDQDHVRELCPTAKFKGAALGCSGMTDSWDCRIVLAADSVIIAAGFPPDLVRRHEIAHCNGWPADHRWALPYEEWAVDADTVTVVASKFDEFASGVLGKTFAEIDKIVDNVPFAPSRPFSLAAAELGLTPKSKITRAILSNPATARPLAKAAGIGNHLSDDEWREAHALAYQTARARQAENAAAASQSVPNLGQVAPQPQQAQPPPSGAAPR
jgi:hypothetical protein